jgi:hypothetical protein
MPTEKSEMDIHLEILTTSLIISIFIAFAFLCLSVYLASVSVKGIDLSSSNQFVPLILGFCFLTIAPALTFYLKRHALFEDKETLKIKAEQERVKLNNFINSTTNRLTQIDRSISDNENLLKRTKEQLDKITLISHGEHLEFKTKYGKSILSKKNKK